MRGPDCLIDTNILLYALSTAPAEAAKAGIARGLIQEAHWGWSAQIAAEFVRAVTSPRQVLPMSRVEAARWVELWLAYPMVAIDGALVIEAIALGDRFHISHFDARVLVAAKRLGCRLVYSEDLNHGQDYGGVRVVNPFPKP